MWAVIGRFRTEAAASDHALATVAQAIGDGAEQLPGHLATNLYATTDRSVLLCTSAWEIESSARSYHRVIEEQRERLMAAYGAAEAEFLLVEQVAA